MGKTRIEAFSDGVLAIVLTIMVLEIKVPHGADWAALLHVAPVFVSYVLSFVYVGIYWNNHHHMFHLVEHASAGIMWANLHLLFWLSLVPVTTAWVGEHPAEPVPAAVYGVVFLLAGAAYWLLTRAVLARHGRDSRFAAAIGSDFKGNISLVIYTLGIGLAFVSTWLAYAAYVAVALMWLLPDRRVERAHSPAP